MGNHTSRRSTLLMTAALALVSLAQAANAQGVTGGGAAAQPAAEQTTMIETVTVTARRKAENLQASPVSVTALTAEDISKRGLDDVLGLQQSTPSLTIMPGGNYSGKSAMTYIRGIGQDQFTFAFQPGVGYYVDGVYYGTVYGSIFELGDISSIQVLRGPQGTLFGKNNEGGAILLSTPEPKGDGSGEITAGYGSYDRMFFKGSFDIPLVADKLALRVSGASNTMDGYVNRVDFACANPSLAGNLKPATTAAGCKVGTEGGDDERSISAALKWTPDSNFTMILRAGYHLDQSGPGAMTILTQNTAPAGSDDANYNTYVAQSLYGLTIDNPAFVTGKPFTTYSTYANPGTGYSAPPVNHETFWNLSDTIDWDTPWGFHVKNIVAYQKYTAEFSNTDGTPIPTFLEYNVLPYHQVSEEFDLSGTALDNRLEWIAGAYYFDSQGSYQGHIELPSTVIVEPGILPFAPDGVYGLDFNLNDVTDTTSWSGFLHGVYHFTDKLSLEAGVRYSVDSKSQSYDHTYTQANPDNILLPAGSPAYAPNAGGTTRDNRFDPKVAVQYQWTPDLMTYASFATGYKAGGINPKPVLDTDITPFREEKLTAYEVGVKSEWLNHRLLLDADAYYSDYRDLQLSEFLPPPLGDGGTIVINAGHARIEGVEANFQAILAPGFSLDGTAGYLSYKNISLGAAAGQVGGPTLNTRPPYTPTWTTSLGLQYDRDFGNYGDAMLRLDWSYRSKVYYDLANTEAGAQDGYGLVNLRLAWNDADDKWSAALQVDNLMDKLYYASKAPVLNADGSLLQVSGTPGMPRTFFFTITRRFH